MKSDQMILFISGIGLTIISFLFILSYLDFYAYQQFENIPVMPIGVTGLQDSLILFAFAIMFIGGLGLFAEGFA